MFPYNAGVMLAHLPRLRETYQDFLAFIMSNTNGLTFPGFGPGDQVNAALAGAACAGARQQRSAALQAAAPVRPRPCRAALTVGSMLTPTPPGRVQSILRSGRARVAAALQVQCQALPCGRPAAALGRSHRTLPRAQGTHGRPVAWPLAAAQWLAAPQMAAPACASCAGALIIRSAHSLFNLPTAPNRARSRRTTWNTPTQAHARNSATCAVPASTRARACTCTSGCGGWRAKTPSKRMTSGARAAVPGREARRGGLSWPAPQSCATPGRRHPLTECAFVFL